MQMFLRSCLLIFIGCLIGCYPISKDKQKVQEAIKKYGLKDGRPEMPIPKDLLEHKNGLGVFINPDEGKEIMQDFTSVVAGLKRKGEGLTEEEEYCLRGFFYGHWLVARTSDTVANRK